MKVCTNKGSGLSPFLPVLCLSLPRGISITYFLCSIPSQQFIRLLMVMTKHTVITGGLTSPGLSPEKFYIRLNKCLHGGTAGEYDKPPSVYWQLDFPISLPCSLDSVSTELISKLSLENCPLGHCPVVLASSPSGTGSKTCLLQVLSISGAS